MKKLLSLMLVTVMVFTLTSCDTLYSILGIEGMGEDDEGTYAVTRNDAERVLSNGYFGFQFTLPEGWYYSYIEEDNITENPGDSMEYSQFAYYDYGDDQVFIEFFDVSNIRNDMHTSHVEFDMYTLSKPSDDYTMTEFVAFLEETMAYDDPADSEDEQLTLVKTEDVTFGSNTYTRVLFETHRARNVGDDFYEDYYVTEINGHYLLFDVIYWADNKDADATIENALGSLMSFSSIA